MGGGVTFNSGSTYEVELKPTGTNDLAGNVAGLDNDLIKADSVTIDNGAKVHVTPENGTDNESVRCSVYE